MPSCNIYGSLYLSNIALMIFFLSYLDIGMLGFPLFVLNVDPAVNILLYSRMRYVAFTFFTSSTFHSFWLYESCSCVFWSAILVLLQDTKVFGHRISIGLQFDYYGTNWSPIWPLCYQHGTMWMHDMIVTLTCLAGSDKPMKSSFWWSLRSVF